jgi:hypothetical protein
MPTILDPILYNRIKIEADKIYKKPSAYKSGWIVKTYKARGGRYANDKKPKNLDRWFKEEWGDIGGEEYPVYRPNIRISKDTPLTADEIDPEQAKEQIALKQIIKGEKNLPPFQYREPHGEGLPYEPYEVLPYTLKQAKKLGVMVLPSLRPSKKIDVFDKDMTELLASVGARGYKDYPTYLKEKGKIYADKRRELYKKRHQKDREVVGSAGWYADKLLW